MIRKLSLDYSAALGLARESRPLITPNPGFEYQLRVWHFCECDVYESDDSTTPDQKGPREKAAYRAWKANRDELLGRGEKAINMIRFKTVAGLAANFGKKRIQKIGESKEEGERIGEGDFEQEQKKKAWENVEKMEKEWTRRLITGKYPPWEEKEKQNVERTEN